VGKDKERGGDQELDSWATRLIIVGENSVVSCEGLLRGVLNRKDQDNVYLGARSDVKPKGQ
jgi:hypothetical protein